MVVRAPAKINLHLSVGPLRPDGYHDLQTVYAAVSLLDEVAVEPAGSLGVVVEGATGVPADGSNLAARAAVLLAERTGRDPAVRIEIRKGIPVAGGCAGGSADAAAALVGCDALWGTGLSRAELAELGAQLGSDVPFCLVGGHALGTGRGERLTPVLGQGTYAWVLVPAEDGLSTPAVYAELDRLRASGPVGLVGDASDVLAALRRGDPAALGRALCNDLQAAALSLRPELRRVLEAGRELGALGGVVSGSGPTVALLARHDAHARELARQLTGRVPGRAPLVAEGPVAGARVVA